MPKFELYYVTEASQSIEVEADSLEEAEEVAAEKLDLRPNISNAFDMGDPVLMPEFSTVDGQPLEPPAAVSEPASILSDPNIREQVIEAVMEVLHSQRCHHGDFNPNAHRDDARGIVAVFDRWLSQVQADARADVTPNPDDAGQHETAYWAVLNALPLPWVTGSTIDANKVADDVARAVLAALREQVIGDDDL